MTKANVLQDIKLCDHLIMPQAISHSKTFDLTSLRRNVEIGYDAACQVLEKVL